MSDPSPAAAVTPAPPTPSAPLTAGSNGVSTPTAGPSGMPQHGALDDEKKMEIVRGMDPNKVANLRRRLLELQSAGQSRESSTEFSKIAMVLDLYNRMKQIDDQRRTSQTGASPSGQANGTPPGGFPAAPTPPSTTGHALGAQQIAQLRAQNASFQLLNRNQPVPAYLQNAASGTPPPGQAGQSPAANPLGPGHDNRVAEKTIESVVAESSENKQTSSSDAMDVDEPISGPSSDGEKVVTPPDAEPMYAMEFDSDSLVYPYNAYTDPNAWSHRKFADEIANPLNKMQRMLVPSTMPQGLDPYLLMQERNKFVETRMAWRMKELEEMDSTFAGGEPGAKDVPNIVETEKKPQSNLGIKARIELLQLRLLGKQRLLREDMVRVMHGTNQVPADRSQFRRFRTHTLRDARATETAERRQRTEREQRGKQRHLEYIRGICDHGQAMIGAGIGTSRGSGAEKMKRLGRAVLKLHADTEREEAKRIERLAKERLKALKNDDEGAYLALLGEAKDSRIGHLLAQTDSYLETLAQAVRDQQNDDVHRDQLAFEAPFEQESGPASEEMFGARRQDGEEAGAEAKAGKVDYYAVAHKIQERVTGQASILTGGTLKDYQVKGLQWMISLYNNRLNGILADEMGLGKTIQTISLITYLIESKRQPGPFLVIVPLSTLTNWTLEFERWAPSVSTVILKGNPAQRRDHYYRLKTLDFQVCLTTYEYIIKERPILSKIKWIHMIIDEGHRMKNVKSKLSQTLNEYYSTRYRLILTGTPLQNNLPELWALLNFVLPKIFNSVKSFDEWFNTPFAHTGGDKVEMNEEEQLLVVKRLHKVLRPFLLRRLKRDVESELPDKVERVIYTKMSALQWKLYESVKKYKTLPMDLSSGKRKQANLQNALMQLKKICNHPYVYREVDEDFNTNGFTDESIIRSAGKFELLDRILPKLFSTGHKVLIFFQMTEIMTIVADFFDYRGWKYCRLDGSTKADDRQALLSTFNDPASPYQVFILSTRAGGLGLNLQSADTVIIYDTDWNPHADLQAQDRAHRIGQKKEVRVLRFISSQTVEELVLQRAQRKLEIDGKVIQAGKFDNVTDGDEYEALLAKAFEAGAEEDSEETNELDDDELNEIIARGDHELELFAKMDEMRKKNQMDDWIAAHQAKVAAMKPAPKVAPPMPPLPPPLMAESELPPFYRRDIGEELAARAQAAEDSLEGRGRRAKNDIRYTDGLTDEQWVNAIEDDDDDIEDAAERKRMRRDKKEERKRMNEVLSRAEAEGKPLNVVKVLEEVEEDTGFTPAKSKKRARPSKSVTPSVMGDAPPKRRKVDEGPTPSEVSFMWKLFNETDKLKSELGEDLSQFFRKPVSKKLYPDYFEIIQEPMTMNEVKKRIGKDPSFGLAQFKNDMHLIWSNAQVYNADGSWPFDAAADLRSFFNDLWNEEIAKVTGGDSGEPSQAPSGTSTPMYKPQDKVLPLPPKIKINVGGVSAQKRLAEIKPDSPSEDSADSGDDDDDDDDY